jgi:hypothetical protein
MADHSKPVLTSLYANFLSELDARIDDLAVGLDPARTAATGQPDFSTRWNSASSKWELWTGTTGIPLGQNLNTWADMASVYNINIGPSAQVNGSTIPTGVTLTSTSDKLSVFSSTTSAELAGVVSDETGSGVLVFNSSPTLTTPTLTLEAGITPTTEGRIQWDTTNDKIVVGDGASTKHFIPTTTFNTDATVSTTGVVTIQTNVVTDAKLRQSGALTVIGRSTNSIGNVADITATPSSGFVLRESGSTIGWGTVGTTGITNSAVTYAKIQNVSATDKLLGRSSAGAGVVEEITCTSFGRSLLDDADATAARTTLALAYFATYAGNGSNQVEVARGGTGAGDGSSAINNLIPGATSGKVLMTNGVGSYYWGTPVATGTNFGTTLTSSRLTYTATAGQTVFTTGTYVLAKGQTRIFVNGVRLFPSDYTETSTTSVTLGQACVAGDQVMCEIDGYVVYNPSASDVSFTPSGDIASNTVQTALAELATEKQIVITASGILKGAGSGSISAASGTDITSLISTNYVTNATNATNLTGSGTVSSTATGTTQAWATNNTTIATTAYVDRLRSVPVSSTSGTAVLADLGKCISITAGITIPANIYAAGDIISLYNNSAGDLTVTQGASLTLRKAGSATAGNLTIPLRGIASIWFLSATEAIMSGAK